MKRPDDLDGQPAMAGPQTVPPDLRALYRSEMPRLMTFFRRRLGQIDDAADLAQETFLRFVRVAPAISPEVPEAYLHRIAVNLLRDRADRGSTRISTLQVPLYDDAFGEEQIDQHRDLEAREQLEYYRGVLNTLKPKTLTIFMLSRVEGLTYQQIGDQLGMKPSGVKRHMCKAIALIARARARRP